MKLHPTILILLISLFSFQSLISQEQNTQTLKAKADSLFEAADSLFEGTQYEKALECYNKTLEIYIKLGDKSKECDILLCIGNIYSRSDDNQKALDCHLRRLEIAREFNNQELESLILGYIATVYNKLNATTKAMECALQSVNISRELGDRKSEALTLYGIANTYMHESNYSEAVKYYNQCLTILRETGNRRGESTISYWIGNAYMQLAEYQKALEYFMRSLTLKKALNDRAGEGKTAFCIGNIYTNLSDYPKALEYYQQALEINREVSDKYNEAKTLANTGLIYGRLSDYLKALEYYQQSLIIRREIKDRQGEGSALGNIGLIYEELINYPKALEFLEKSLAIQREIGDQKSEFSTLCGIGNIYREYSDYPKALECYKQSLEITREVNDPRRESWALYCIGELYYVQKNYIAASDYAQKAMRITQELDTYGDLEKYYTFLLGECNVALGLDSMAIVNFRESIETVETVRGKLEVESQKRNYAAKVSKLYGDMVLALLRIERNEDAYSYVERGRARSFLDLLASGEVEVAKTLIDPKKQYEPELASMIAVNPLTLPEVQQLLDVRTNNYSPQPSDYSPQTVLEYFITEEKLLIWQITKDNVQIYKIDILSEDLKEMIEAFRETIALVGSTDYLSRELYKILIEPAASQIDSENLIIIPHSILHYLPFQALQNQNGKYLLEKYRISYLPSASVLKYLIPKRREKGDKLLALGNPAIIKQGYKPLKFAEEEVDGISKLYGNVEVLIGKSATETNFRGLASKYDILHLACHSELNSSYPLFSGLLLAPDSLHDGELDVHEVFTMNLNAYMVVLSGCETGMGHLTTGDELVGLSRAFIYAGTPSLLASIWRVEDESTGYLMTNYYRNLKTSNKAESLRKAQLAAKEKYNDIFFWAPFVLIGDEN